MSQGLPINRQFNGRHSCPQEVSGSAQAPIEISRPRRHLHRRLRDPSFCLGLVVAFLARHLFGLRMLSHHCSISPITRTGLARLSRDLRMKNGTAARVGDSLGVMPRQRQC